MIKKIVIALLLISLTATPCYAWNVFDKILYKDVLLRANRTHVMVNRFTREVKFIRLTSGKWIRATGVFKNQAQAMYNTQLASGK